MAKLDSYEIGRNVQKQISITLEVNKKELERGAFGRFKWRFYWCHFCIWLMNLAYKSEVKIEKEEI